MNKAVLIMDMPKSCGDCVFSNPDGDYCPFLGEVTLSEYEGCKKANCPLRELPEKHNTDARQVGEQWAVFNQGWNACLDAIEGRKTNE